MILDEYGNAACVKPIASGWIDYVQIQIRRLVFEGPTSAGRLGWSLECGGGQGYYFAQPMPFNELKEFFERESPELLAPADRYGDVPTIATVQ